MKNYVYRLITSWSEILLMKQIAKNFKIAEDYVKKKLDEGLKMKNGSPSHGLLAGYIEEMKENSGNPDFSSKNFEID